MARRVGAIDGSFTIACADAIAPEDKVVTRKTWITWKTKYHVSVFNSTSANVAAPASLKSTRGRQSVGLHKGK